MTVSDDKQQVLYACVSSDGRAIAALVIALIVLLLPLVLWLPILPGWVLVGVPVTAAATWMCGIWCERYERRSLERARVKRAAGTKKQSSPFERATFEGIAIFAGLLLSVAWLGVPWLTPGTGAQSGIATAIGQSVLTFSLGGISAWALVRSRLAQRGNGQARRTKRLQRFMLLSVFGFSLGAMAMNFRDGPISVFWLVMLVPLWYCFRGTDVQAARAGGRRGCWRVWSAIAAAMAVAVLVPSLLPTIRSQLTRRAEAIVLAGRYAKPSTLPEQVAASHAAWIAKAGGVGLFAMVVPAAGAIGLQQDPANRFVDALLITPATNFSGSGDGQSTGTPVDRSKLVGGTLYRLEPRLDEEVYSQKTVDLGAMPIGTSDDESGDVTARVPDAQVEAITGTVAARHADIESIVLAFDNPANRLRATCAAMLGLAAVLCFQYRRAAGPGIVILAFAWPLLAGLTLGMAGVAGAMIGIGLAVIGSGLLRPPPNTDRRVGFLEEAFLHRSLIVIAMMATFPAAFGLALWLGPLL